MNDVLLEPWGAVSAVVAVVAICALVAVLVLLGRERGQVRRARELLVMARELRHRYDALQSVTKEGVLVLSLSGRVLDISERAAAILGVDARAAVGRAVTDLPIVVVNEQGLSMNPAAVLSHRSGASGAGYSVDSQLVGIVLAGQRGAQARMVQVATQLVPVGDGSAPAVLTTLEIVLIVTGYMIVLGVMNWRIALLSLLPLPVWTWYITRFSRQVQPASKAVMEAQDRNVSLLAENIAGVHVVKAFATEGRR